MKDSEIYQPLWQKYRPAIISKMKLALTEPQEYQLSKHEFEAIGDREKAGYTFNLEITNGVVVNNIEGTAVARDLFAVLKSSKTALELMNNHSFKINLTKDYKFKIQSYQ